MNKVGIYPGTFDPIHSGHVAFALESVAKCSLDSVVLLPEPSPRGKQNVTGIEQRVDQIKVVIENFNKLKLLLLSSNQFSTTNSLAELQDYFPEARLSLLIGSDVALTLAGWNNVEKLLEVCDLIVGMRHNDSSEYIKKTLADLSTQKLTFVNTSRPHVSSSKFRMNF